MMLVKIFEFVGTVAFAFSGALVGMQKKLDLFGVVFLGIITSVGGGIFRDVILGQTPPKAFQDPTAGIISIICSIGAFYIYPIMVRKNIFKKKKNLQNDYTNKPKYMTQEQMFKLISKQTQLLNLKKVIFICDAIGLATFTVIGANLAFYSEKSNIFLVTCMGLITGVGGGMLRDTFVQDTPLIFRREIYAVASVLGSIAFYFCQSMGYNYRLAFTLCFSITFLSRMISLKYNLNLPRYSEDK